MASKSNNEQCRILRHVCNRLDAAGQAELPHLASVLASSLPLCRELLAASDESLKTFAKNASVLSSRYRAKLSSLIQHRAEWRKLAAIKLIKTTVNVGGYEMIAKSGHWVRGLVGCIRTAWPTLRRLAIVTLISIFKATHGLPNLTREITTPTLPDFISTCINSVAPKQANSDQRTIITADNEYVVTVLSALAALVPNHPAIFRPFLNQLTAVLGSLIAPSRQEDDDGYVYRSEKVRACAQSLHALLPRCATKNENGPGGSRAIQIRLIEQQIQYTIDEVYRALEMPMASRDVGPGKLQQYSSSRSKPEDPPSSEVLDGLQLKGWTGLDAGVDRLVDLLHLLEAHIATIGNESYAVPVRILLDVLQRAMAAFPGQHTADLSIAARKADITTDEFEMLFSHAQEIQVAVLDCLVCILNRLGPTNKGLANGVLEDLSWRLRGYTESASLRSSFYRACCSCVGVIGPSLTASSGAGLEKVLIAATRDLLGDSNTDKSSGLRTSITNGRQDADTILQSNAMQSRTLKRNAASSAAATLIQATLQWIPATSLTKATNIACSRAAVLVSDEEMMLAAVLNTSTAAESSGSPASILPHLARKFPGSMVVEGVMRPRHPVIASRAPSKKHWPEGFGSTPFEVRPSRDDDGQFEDMNEAGQMDLDVNGSSNVGNHGEALNSDLGNTATSAGFERQPSPPFMSVPIFETPAPPDMTPRPKSPVIIENPGYFDPPEPPLAEDLPERAEHRPATLKRIKLATFEAAPGPTSVSAISQSVETPTLSAPLPLPMAAASTGTHTKPAVDDGDSDSGDSEIPPIIMDEEEEEEDEEDGAS